MAKADPNDAVATIVAAYAGRQDVTADDIVALAARLKHHFAEGSAEAGEAPADPRARPAPAIAPEKAVTEDKVFCLCCGKGFKMLKRHLGAEHGLTEAEYRQLFGLPEDMPLVAPNYSRQKASYAKRAGFGKYERAPRDGATQGEGVS
ncbi:MucR family transcriptional regulator [Tranquillimonas alkanivorans]|uniref:Transcriptional regulator, MucR family n=1 Tax=Tranquillimonas alkanivorans TaxID=441119 RepID=A0A1I5S5L9_9RHOB|nr:MucR family transcriptional regulator [Tranquillimonas alkanivorans]SFP66019.1 transcriptional regulator, MucR family [Tranquillimonas alkanivorans]